ncbi:MAG: class I SAM-dependent methyltransferase [Actinophytocola sp.]|uniref:class I SAM-dependent methyltransferase n=1 Tax=Actinophytocola sp. TaxID=1872138 RepID=UPI003D6AAF0D
MIEFNPWGLVEELVHVDGGPRTTLGKIVDTYGADAVVAVLVAELRARVDHHAAFGRVTLLVEISCDTKVFRHVLEFDAGRVVARPAGSESPDVSPDVTVRFALDDLVRRLYPAADRPDRMGWDYEPTWTDEESVAKVSRASHLVRAATTRGGGDLDELAVRFGSDKYGHHHWYTQHYDAHLRPLRDQPVRVLEIGIGGYDDPRSGGESLRMWEQYFRRGLIHGLDLHPKEGVESTRIRTAAGDQGDPELLARLGAQLGPFDVIIDDGSHVNEHVVTSFEALFPHLVDEGYYVVEDTQTAYWPAYGGAPAGSAAPGTSLAFLTRLTDALNHREYRDSEVPTDLERSVAGISFFHNMVFVKKAVNGENALPVWARG